MLEIDFKHHLDTLISVLGFQTRRNRFWNFDRGPGRPKGETGGPKAPPKSRQGATGATEGAEELSESALGAQNAILAECVLT